MEAKSPVRGFVYGGLASAAAEAVTIPVDVLKVRMQLQGECGSARQYRNTADAAVQIARSEGPRAFLKGLKPAVVRQLTYGSLRFGLYTHCKELYGVPANSMEAVPLRKALAAMTAGGVAAFVCTPIDLIKVRMQAHGMPGHAPLPAYRGMGDALASIVRQEGALGLYKGVGPTSLRAAAVGAAEIASYEEVKLLILRRQWFRDGVPLHLATGVLSGLVASAASSPFDVVKSRLMSQPFDARGVGLHYAGMLDCFAKSRRAEGIGFAFKGFFPICLNKCPTVVLLFVLYEQIKRHGDRWLDSRPAPAASGTWSPPMLATAASEARG
mmetsp:Transcript_80307/g.236231  ORF Transcript_80307/g.236231 Transcript_80307/m.236231 type:complete len:326 (+) Transcript_80307:213-1190(+)